MLIKKRNKELNNKQMKRLKHHIDVSNNESKEDAIFGNGKYSKNSNGPAVRFVIK